MAQKRKQESNQSDARMAEQSEVVAPDSVIFGRVEETDSSAEVPTSPLASQSGSTPSTENMTASEVREQLSIRERQISAIQQLTKSLSSCTSFEQMMRETLESFA